jgi:Spy/CpxP family protein refolding chaperone
MRIMRSVRWPCLVAGAVCVLTACASTPNASHSAAQVDAGTSSSIEAGSINADTPSKQQQTLDGALTPETRQKLQEAMDSNRTPAGN